MRDSSLYFRAIAKGWWVAKVVVGSIDEECASMLVRIQRGDETKAKGESWAEMAIGVESDGDRGA